MYNGAYHDRSQKEKLKVSKGTVTGLSSCSWKRMVEYGLYAPFDQCKAKKCKAKLPADSKVGAAR